MTLRDHLTAIGGGAYVASLLNVSEAQVSRWARGLLIPERHLPLLCTLLKLSRREVIAAQIEFLQQEMSK